MRIYYSLESVACGNRLFIHSLFIFAGHQISTILNGGQIVKKRSVVTAASDWSTELPPHLDHHLDIIIIQFQMLPREMFETWRIIK